MARHGAYPDRRPFRDTENPARAKPLIVLELGVCQSVAEAAYLGPWRESMADRAESWLGGSNAVTLVDVAEGCGVRVMVQLWRRRPVLVQQWEFEVQDGAEVWGAREERFSEGVTFLAADVGEGGEEVFLLPMWCLRHAVVTGWASCREAVAVGIKRRGR